MNKTNTIKLRVWGDLACFTRPEMKVERVSYDVMTPSAARNILQAILWKPAIEWSIKQVDVLKPVRWISIRRNEVSEVVPVGSVNQVMNGGNKDLSIYIEDKRQQRAGMMLRDVEYVIHADFQLTKRAGEGDTEIKFRETFLRRAKYGQCFTQPYFGCRECAAYFELVEDGADRALKTIDETRDLGWMLYDLDFSTPRPEPAFFFAALNHGRMIVPDAHSESIKR